MIVQVRGWSGSGKSTLIRRLITDHAGEEVEQPNRPNFVRISSRTGNETNVRPRLWSLCGNLYVLGNYNLETETTVGADFISGEVGHEIMHWYASKMCESSFHMVFEGRNPSVLRPVGRWLDEVLRPYGIVWATLDIDVEVARQNVLVGRGGSISAARPESFDNGHRYTREYVLLAREAGIRCETLHYPDAAYAELHTLLEEGGWVCTSPTCAHNSSYNFNTVVPTVSSFQ